VLWRPDRAAFFVAHGMPMNPKVMCFARKWGWDCQGDLSGFGDWLDGNIKSLYARYLLSHPLETTVVPFFRLRRLLLGADGPKGMSYYFNPLPAWYFWLGRIWLEWLPTLLALIAGFVFAARRMRERQALAPALVILASLPPMLLFIWHADAHEAMRHALVPSALLRLGLVFGILLAYDWMSLVWRASAHDGKTSL
jgi:hypothetical protein